MPAMLDILNVVRQWNSWGESRIGFCERFYVKLALRPSYRNVLRYLPYYPDGPLDVRSSHYKRRAFL